MLGQADQATVGRACSLPLQPSSVVTSAAVAASTPAAAQVTGCITASEVQPAAANLPPMQARQLSAGTSLPACRIEWIRRADLPYAEAEHLM